jgi:hypothetical protein
MKWIGHGLATKINKPVVALRVGTIKPVESRAVFTEAGVNSSQVKRRNIARLPRRWKSLRALRAPAAWPKRARTSV